MPTDKSYTEPAEVPPDLHALNQEVAREVMGWQLDEGPLEAWLKLDSSVQGGVRLTGFASQPVPLVMKTCCADWEPDGLFQSFAPVYWNPAGDWAHTGVVLRLLEEEAESVTLDFDRDYGIDHRTGWSLHLDGICEVQFAADPREALCRAAVAWARHKREEERR